MPKFIANRIVNGEINTIIGILNEKQCTYTETWYFNGRIYKREERFFQTSSSAKYDYDVACRLFSKDTQLIHEN